MSGAEKAFSIVKAILSYQERMDGLEEKLSGLNERLTRLADSHASLRDRVSRIEGIIEGAAMTRGKSQPRIER